MPCDFPSQSCLQTEASEPPASSDTGQAPANLPGDPSAGQPGPPQGNRASLPQTQALSPESGAGGQGHPAPDPRAAVKGSSHWRIKQGEGQVPCGERGRVFGGLLGRATSAFLVLGEDLQKVPQPRGRKQLESQAPGEGRGGVWKKHTSHSGCAHPTAPGPHAPGLGQRQEEGFSPGGSPAKVQVPRPRPEPSASSGPRFAAGQGTGQGARPSWETSAMVRGGCWSSAPLVAGDPVQGFTHSPGPRLLAGGREREGAWCGGFKPHEGCLWL